MNNINHKSHFITVFQALVMKKNEFFGRKSTRRIIHTFIVYFLLTGIGLVILLPVSWLITASLKSATDPIYTIPTDWFPTKSFHFENFWTALTYPSYPLWKPAIISSILVLINIIGTTLSCSFVAYGFARLNFSRREIIFKLVIMTMLIPSIVLLVPRFLFFHEIGWYGTFYPLWVPSFFATSAWSIFIIRQYMRSFPRDLDDAARIDGCSYLGVFRYVILPLSKPVLTVVAIFNFLEVWNDFINPLIYLNNSRDFTLAIALEYFRRSAFSNATLNTTNLLMASTLLSILPVLIVYFLMQKQLIGGIASVGIKG
jgi:ABC-type glycerol-3-phosphate transport system permease component